MTDLRTSLIDDDPLDAEPALPRGDVEAMRRRVLTAHPTPAVRRWTCTLTLAAALVAIVAAGVSVTRRGGPGVVAATGGANAGTRRDAREGRRQLQFATPGGTRVIWVFNADFETR